MSLPISFISNFIEKQFPEFYLSEGQNFVQFVKAYYEWQESISTTRELIVYRDIDTTLDEYLDHFKNEIMPGIPVQILGDKRLLAKHILNLYNAKGSIEGMKLVFRLLYNTEIEYYIPANDIFKLDDSIWFEPKYLEISKFETNSLFVNQNIIGTISRAHAIVESYERRNINGRIIDLLFISNIEGSFIHGENITFEGITITEPTILGSIDTVIINSSAPGFAVGDNVIITDDVDGKYFEGLVNEVKNSSDGIINFELIDGGNGYTLDSIVTVSTGSNTTGSGAAMEITALSNTWNLGISDITISPYTGIYLAANNYSSSNTDNSAFASANLSTIIWDALDYDVFTFGTISKIATTNPGHDYNGNVNVHIYEPISAALNIDDRNGNIYGNDAVVTTSSFYGFGVPSSVSVINSGYNYTSNSMNVSMISTTNTINQIQATVYLGGVGKSEGYWKDSTSFVDSDKYLQDDDYYQEFSYELILRKKITEYYSILKQTVHPAGNKMFGKVRLITEG